MKHYINGDIGVLFWNDGQVDVCDSVNRSIVHLPKQDAILRHFEEEKK